MIEKMYSSTEPERAEVRTLRTGSHEIRLHRNIRQEDDGEGGQIWTADEVLIVTRLEPEEVLEHFDDYFEEKTPVTLEDLAEAVDILAGIILEGQA